MRKWSPLLLSMLLLSDPALAQADAISAAVANEHRQVDARLRDEYRHPQQTLRFFDVEPQMTVVEVSPGGGWYTDILAPLLQQKGKLIAAHFYVDEDSPGYYRRSLDNFKQRMLSYPPYSAITLSAFHPQKATDIAPANSADVVLTFRNVHNWYMGDKKQGVADAFAAFYRVLKPGGVLGVVDHRLPESAADAEMTSSGYMKQSYVIQQALAAGFKLVATSEINANPVDTADHPRGVWTLPPSLRLKEQNKKHYLSIGESDRMTLKFVKPE